LCAILVTFGPVTPAFMLLTAFARYGKNWHITPNISEYPGPILTYFAGLLVVLVGMLIPVAQGMLLWKPVKYGRCSQTSPGTTFTLRSGIRQRIHKFGELLSNNLRVYDIRSCTVGIENFSGLTSMTRYVQWGKAARQSGD